MKRTRSRRTAGAALLLLGAMVLAACGGGGSSSSSGGKATLTLWENYGTEQNAVATKALIAAFEKANPNITIKMVSQPADNYFSLLQASAVSQKGPDLAVMWTGVYDLKYANFLENLKGNVSQADLSKVGGLRWTAPNFDTSQGSYVMPLETQFYIGFYNKKLFKQAGVASVPTDWSQLDAACTKLKAIGVTPIVYGNGGQSLGAEFYPWYDASYMMIGAHSVNDWSGLYSGSIPWTSSSNVSQLTQWAKLKSSGCTNPDVLTKTNNLQDFEGGKAAMMVDGTWDTAQFTKSMGANVAAFVPPFSSTPIKGVVNYPGDGFSVMKYSKNKTDDFKFLSFMTTPQASSIINKAGLIPDITGTTTTNPVNQQMLNFVSQDHMTAYPMLDNVVQVDVVNSGSKVLPAVLAGQQSPSSALSSMQGVLKGLPASQKTLGSGG